MHGDQVRYRPLRSATGQVSPRNKVSDPQQLVALRRHYSKLDLTERTSLGQRRADHRLVLLILSTGLHHNPCRPNSKTPGVSARKHSSRAARSDRPWIGRRHRWAALIGGACANRAKMRCRLAAPSLCMCNRRRFSGCSARIARRARATSWLATTAAHTGSRPACPRRQKLRPTQVHVIAPVRWR